MNTAHPLITAAAAEAVRKALRHLPVIALTGNNSAIYSLTYDTATDQLGGIYFQAALKQQFEVFFQRLK